MVATCAVMMSRSCCLTLPAKLVVMKESRASRALTAASTVVGVEEIAPDGSVEPEVEGATWTIGDVADDGDEDSESRGADFLAWERCEDIVHSIARSNRCTIAV